MATELSKLVVALEAQTSVYVAQLDKANNKLASFEAATKKSLSSIDKTFKTVLTVAGVVELARTLGDLSDSYTKIENKLRPVATSTENLRAVQEEVFKVAQRSHSAFESTAELYSRLADSADGLGLSQTDLASVTETVSKAIQLEGQGAEESANAAILFAKGLADGSLAGGELQKTLKNFPDLAAAIARGFGVQVAELKYLGEQGKVTTAGIINALKGQAPQIESQFSKMNVTIGQSFVMLRNSFVQSFGKIAQSGFGAGIASTVQALANNIEGLAKTLLVGAVAWATFRAALIIAPVVDSAKAFLALFSAVASGDAILLGSAAAESARAAAALAGAEAEAVKTAAVAAGLRVQIAEIDAFATATAATAANTGVILVNARGQAALAGSIEATNAVLIQRTVLQQQLTAVEAEAAIAQKAVAAAGVRTAASAAASTGAFGLLRASVASVLGPLRGLIALVASNPLTAVIAGIVAAGAALYAFRNDIKTSADGVITLRDTTVAAWQLMSEGLAPLGTAITNTFKVAFTEIRSFFSKLPEVAKPAFEFLKKAFALSDIAQAINLLDKQIDKVVGKVQGRARQIATARNSAVGAITTKAGPATTPPAGDPAALKKIDDLQKSLQAQIVTENLGAVATIKFRIAHGDLKDEFEKAGPKADKYRSSLAALTAQIEGFKIQKMVDDLQQQIDTQDMGAASTMKYRIEQGDLKKTFEDLGKSVDPLKQKLVELASAEDDRTFVNLSRDLQQQVATFDQSGAAVLEYRLKFGDLAKAYAGASEAGKGLADTALALQKALDAKQVDKQLKDIDAQVQELQGHTAEAATMRFDTANMELVGRLTEANNQKGLEQVNTLRLLTKGQAEFTALETEGGRITGELAVQEERIRNSQQVGAINESQAMQQTSQAREVAVAQLETIAQKMKAVEGATTNPALVDGIKKFGAEIEKLQAQTELLAQSIRTGFQDAFGNAINDFISGTKSASDAFKGFIKDIVSQMLMIESKNIAQELVGGLVSATGGGGASSGQGIFSALAGMFAASGKASGGPVSAGTPYVVGEKGPEVFVPHTSGSIQPNVGGGGVTVHQTFMLQAPQGLVSRQTQMQLGAQAARGLETARRRNG